MPISGLIPSLGNISVDIFVKRNGDDRKIVHDPFSLKVLCVRKILQPIEKSEAKIDVIDDANSELVDDLSIDYNPIGEIDPVELI